MKICIVSSVVFSVPLHNYGGLELVAWQQARGLAAKGHTISLVAPDGSSCPGCTVIPTGPPGRHDERMAYNVYWKHLLEVDAVVDHSWGKYSYLLKAEGRLKIPILGWCHAPVNTMFQFLPPVEKPCFVCISDDQKAHFEGLFGKPARRCYNGVDAGYYQPIDTPRSGRYLFLARFSTIKGPDLAITACREGGAELDLVGDTSITNEPELFARCQAACDGRRIRMVGPASRGSCVWWFSQAHALLHLNSRFREPYGLAPVEAMLCGTPVIAWRYGACQETVAHGKSGFLVSSLSEAVELIRSDAAATIDRRACREWASQFSVQAMVDRVEELCNEALGSGGW